MAIKIEEYSKLRRDTAIRAGRVGRSCRNPHLLFFAVSASAAERRQVFYSGHVQGVGFRFTACQLAAGFEVTGYVKNLSDGRVEVVAEGEASELDRFLAAIAHRMEGNIRDVKVDARPATGEFNRFETRH